MSTDTDRNKILKDKQLTKFNKKYTVPNTQFRRAIYDGIAFVDNYLNKKIQIMNDNSVTDG